MLLTSNASLQNIISEWTVYFDNTGWFFGDPHIRTLDGLTYTMNGLGEYVLIVTTTGEFTLQGRTTRALDSNGNEILGTIFCAFAASDANSDVVHVEMNEKRDGDSNYLLADID